MRKATKRYWKQCELTEPNYFWTNASADCLVDALSKYAESTDVPLSEMVNEDGSFGLKGDGSSSDFNLNLETCIERAWQDVGASLP